MNSPLDKGVKLVVFHHRKMLGRWEIYANGTPSHLTILSKDMPSIGIKQRGRGLIPNDKLCQKYAKLLLECPKQDTIANVPEFVCAPFDPYMCAVLLTISLGLVHQLVKMIQVQESGILISFFLRK